ERKHGCSTDELAARLAEMRAELEELEGAESRLSEIGAAESAAAEACHARALALRLARKKAARRLAQAIEAELVALHIPNARLDVLLRAVAEGGPGPRRADRAEFMCSANAGEPLAARNRVASGGEVSRVLLAVKGVLATGDRVVTYVFDEVDAGVGGAVAEAIGRRLARTATSRQVLCITHLPQIAAFADAHFRVEKHSEGVRTVTRVRRIDGGARVVELALMLAGAEVFQISGAFVAQLLGDAYRLLRDYTSRFAPLGSQGFNSTLSAKSGAKVKANGANVVSASN